MLDQFVVHRDEHCSQLPVRYADVLPTLHSGEQPIKVVLPLLNRVEWDVRRCRQLFQVR